MKCLEVTIGPRDVAQYTTRNDVVLKMRHDQIKRKVFCFQTYPQEGKHYAQNLTMNNNIVFYTDGSCTAEFVRARIFGKSAKL